MNGSDNAGRRWALRCAVFLVGAWIMLTMTMAFTAGKNFGILDAERMRDADLVYADIPHEGQRRRMALRYAASELNRYYFALYGSVQLVIGAAALAVYAASRRGGRIVVSGLVASVLTVVLMWAWLIPEITEVGRQIDFEPRSPRRRTARHSTACTSQAWRSSRRNSSCWRL